jgi:hypothetical protein
MSISPAPAAGDDLLAGERESYRRGFLVGMSLAANAADRAAVAESFLRTAGRFGETLAEPANAALAGWAHDELARSGRRHIDLLA